MVLVSLLFHGWPTLRLFDLTMSIFNRLRYSTDWDDPTPSSTLHQKQLLKRLRYSDNITWTTGITTTFNKEKNSRITLLHKAIHEKVAIPIPSCIIKPTKTWRFHQPKRYIQISLLTWKRSLTHHSRFVTSSNMTKFLYIQKSKVSKVCVFTSD
jgi:hypothetical protein